MQVHRGRGEREADGAVGGGWLTQVGHHPAIIESGPRNHLRATHGKHASVRSCTFASARRMGNCRVAVGGTAGAGSPCPVSGTRRHRSRPGVRRRSSRAPHPRGPSSAGPPSLHRKHGKVCALGRPPLAAFSPIVTSELRFACHNFLINAPPHPLLPTPLAVRLRAPTASFCKWGETDIRMSKSEMNMKMLLLVQNFTESKLVSQFVRGRLCHQESGRKFYRHACPSWRGYLVHSVEMSLTQVFIPSLVATQAKLSGGRRAAHARLGIDSPMLARKFTRTPPRLMPKP